MDNFKDIKSQWAERKSPFEPEKGYKEIIEKTRHLKKKQGISQIVLGGTVVILIFFFFYVSAYKNTQVFWGLGIMMGSLVIRMIIEYFSIQKIGKIPPYENMKHYNQRLISYYKGRKIIHFLITPLLFGIYIFGFILLLPSFEISLSQGFYTYILVSSVFVFVALAILITVQVKKELYILKKLLR